MENKNQTVTKYTFFGSFVLNKSTAVYKIKENQGIQKSKTKQTKKQTLFVKKIVIESNE